MRQVIFYVILFLGMISCDLKKSKLPTEQTKFIVERIDSGDSDDAKISYYRLRAINECSLNVSTVWFCDSAGKYKTNDTLVFTLYKK